MKKKFIGKNSKIRNFLREKLKFTRQKSRNYRRFWELWKLHLNLKCDIELWQSGENATKNTKKWQNAKFWTENPQNKTNQTTSKRKNEKLFFSIHCGYSFPLFAIRKRGKRGKQKLFEIFRKNSLQKENCVVLCRRKGIPTAISRAY